MEALFATHNKAKLQYYKEFLEFLGIKIYSLDDLKIDYDVEEKGNTSTENAIQKAKEYCSYTNMITIAVDDSLELDNVPEDLQPGVHVRRINGNSRATDSELIDHYVGLVNQYGQDGKLNGRYIKCLAVAKPNEEVKYCNYVEEEIFVNKVLEKKHEGYPLDSMSITPFFNKYTVELTEQENQILKEKNNVEMINFLKNTF